MESERRNNLQIEGSKRRNNMQEEGSRRRIIGRRGERKKK
jgi:hypothetical protein